MRGSSEFPVMKGFMEDYTVKGGENPETMPADQGELADKEKLTEAPTGGEPKKGKKVTNAPDLTIADDLSTVEEGAKKDIKDSYVADVQESKGFKAFNSLVEKGLVVDVDINSASDVKTICKGLEEVGTQMVEKSLGSRVGNVVRASKRGLGEGARMAKMEASGPINRVVGKVKDVGNKIGEGAKTAENFAREHPGVAGTAVGGAYLGGQFDARYAANRKAKKAQEVQGAIQEKCGAMPKGMPMKKKGLGSEGEEELLRAAEEAKKNRG